MGIIVLLVIAVAIYVILRKGNSSEGSEKLGVESQAETAPETAAAPGDGNKSKKKPGKKAARKSGEMPEELQPVPYTGEDSVREVASHSSSRAYRVDLGKLKCTCKDFSMDRKRFPINDPRRLCKHLVEAMADPDVFQQQPVVIQEVIKKKYAVHRNIVAGSMSDAEGGDDLNITMFYDPDKSWINIVAPAKKKPHDLRMYGYNAMEDRWAYGKLPYQAEVLADWVQQQMG